MSILALTSNTLIGTPAAGQIEYNGQFYGTDSNAARAQMQRITLGTATASTSGTSVSFSSIPSWVKRVTLIFSGVSTNGASNLAVQIGPVAGVETSSYSGYAWTGNTSSVGYTTEWAITGTNSAANAHSGSVTLFLQDSATNTWVMSATGGGVGINTVSVAGGTKAIAGVLSVIRVIGSNTGSPVDTFDAGSINILYEG